MAESTSEVDICNGALTMIGDNTITSLTEGTTRSVVCAQHYHKSRNALLRGYPWNFAMKREALAQLVETPEWGFAYYYQLPTDSVRVWKINHDQKVAWRREGDRIATDLESLDILYISKVTDPNKFDELFIDALTVRLASKICFPLTAKRTLASDLFTLYKDMLAEAEDIDTQEGEPEEYLQDFEFLEAR